MINFKCPSCSHEIKAKPEHAGKKGKCKKCGESVKVPEQVISVFDSPEYQKQLREAEAAIKSVDSAPPQPVQQIIYIQAPGINTAKIIIVVSSVIGMIATFLPWATAPIIGSINGSAGDGWFSFIFFAASLLIAVSGAKSNRITEFSKFMILVFSALCIVLFFLKWSNINSVISSNRADNPFINTIQIGIGLYLVGIAGVVNIVTLFFANHESRAIKTQPLP